MLTLIRKQTRKDTSIPFYVDAGLITSEYRQYLKTNYIDTGMLISYQSDVSEDGLTMTGTATWASHEAFNAYFTDPYCIENFIKPSAEYDQINQIASESVSDTGFVKPSWKHLNASDYFKDIVIPDDWNSLEEFVDWFIEQRMPLMVPWNASVIRSDDAVAICVFRKGNYQVEFYIEYPQMYIYKHSHPRMEVITMQLGGGSTYPPADESSTVSSVWGSLTSKLTNGNYHGGDADAGTGNGFVILAFQRWENPEEMTSAAVQWKGAIQGETQAKTIRTHYPDAYIVDGYADITRDRDGNLLP